MTLNSCSKQELIEIIEHNIEPDKLKTLLETVSKNRREAADSVKKRLEAIVVKNKEEYDALMKPYEGKQPIEIPIPVLQKGHMLLHAASDAADALARFEETTQ